MTVVFHGYLSIILEAFTDCTLLTIQDWLQMNVHRIHEVVKGMFGIREVKTKTHFKTIQDSNIIIPL